VIDLMTNIDDNGRIELPLAIRYGLHLIAGDKIAVDQLGDGTIILKKIGEQQILAAKEISETGSIERHRVKTSA
jgi:AbrB family looped-hinge helix DNA binding protein